MKKGRTAMTRAQHFRRDCLRGVNPFGRGVNNMVSVLLVPELRKRRSERNQELVKQQVDGRFDRLAELRNANDQQMARKKKELAEYL
jgi:hypothetical protein